jgi:hypothetical protein
MAKNFELIDQQNTRSMFMCLCNYFANLSPQKLDIQLLADKKKSNVTLDSPKPTGILLKSDPITDWKGTFASPDVAFGRRVLPDPGGPNNKKFYLSTEK